MLVWAGISYDGRTDLYVIRDGALTDVRYRDETFNPNVHPCAGACDPGFIMKLTMHDHIVHVRLTST